MKIIIRTRLSCTTKLRRVRSPGQEWKDKEKLNNTYKWHNHNSQYGYTDKEGWWVYNGKWKWGKLNN